MTQVSSPPLGALEIPRQSEEQNQGAGLTTSFAHGRAWAGVCPCRSMALQSKAIYPPRLTAGQALVGGATCGRRSGRGDILIRRLTVWIPRLSLRSAISFFTSTSSRLG
jgi:hypothetical protein